MRGERAVRREDAQQRCGKAYIWFHGCLLVGIFLFGIALGGVCDEILKADELRCVLGRFDGGDGFVEGFSVAARLSKDTEDHIIDLQNAIGGRTFVHCGDEDLPGCGGEVFMAEKHPAAESGGAEQPVVGIILLSASGEIGRHRTCRFSGG